MKAEADERIKEISKLKAEVETQKKQEEKLIAKMKILTEEAGNAAALAEECKDLKKENKSMKKELDGVAEKFKEEKESL